MSKYRTIAPKPTPQPPLKKVKVVRAGHDEDNTSHNQQLGQQAAMLPSQGTYIAGSQASSYPAIPNGHISFDQQVSDLSTMSTHQASSNRFDQGEMTYQHPTSDTHDLNVDPRLQNDNVAPDNTSDEPAYNGIPVMAFENAIDKSAADGPSTTVSQAANISVSITPAGTISPTSVPSTYVAQQSICQAALGPVRQPTAVQAAPVQLAYTSYAQAQPYAFRRTAMNVAGDNVGAVSSNQAQYVQQIMTAFLNPNCMAPPLHRRCTQKPRVITSDEAQGWNAWQTAAGIKTDHILHLPNAMTEAEVRAWSIVDEVLKIHDPAQGYRLTNLNVDTTLLCSQRLQQIIQLIWELKIVRQNILEDGNLHDLCAAPVDYGKDRERQMWSNHKRDTKNKPRAQRNPRQAAQADGLGRAAMKRMTAKEIQDKKDGLKAQKPAKLSKKTTKQKSVQPKTETPTASYQPDGAEEEYKEPQQQDEKDDTDGEYTPAPKRRKRAA